ncbi:hypothetical protein J3R83DRAFT_3424 [Lanmaoa asiatica]|nr:hypothetical protein J3R83DRAFT_3424 [Lanmaoa asiatica]
MPAKSSSRDKNKKLTDFFGQRPSPVVPALATSSGPTGTTTTSTTRRRPVTRASKATVDRDSFMNYSAPPQMRSTSTMVTRKRARSPDSNNPNTSSLPPPLLKSTRKPMKIIRSDSNSERRTPVICITPPFTSRNSLAQRPTPVQVHNNSLVASPLDSSKQVVYSSQSDEAELVLPNPESCDLGKVVESVHTWRRKAFKSSNSSASRAREDAMEVDPLPSSPIRGSPVALAWNASSHCDAPVRSAEMSESSAAVQTPVVVSASLPSPSDTDELPPLPPTPEPIGPEAKTAKLIAEIKARAFAANQSSDDERPLSFRELEDSDDGELIDDLPLIGGAWEQRALLPAPRTASDIFSSPLSPVPSTFGDETIGFRTFKASDGCSPSLRPIRASTRTRKLAAAFHLPLTIAESSTSVIVTKSASFPSNRKSRAMNPLHALLREKESEDKRGTSCAALRLAEEAIRQGSREASVGSDDEFDAMNRLCLADEQAAWKAVHESRQSTSPVGPSDMEDVTIGDRESEMLGAVAGEAINKILAGDKDSKGKEKAQNIDQKMTPGIPLWTQSSDEDMEIDSMSTPPLSGHPILTRLDDFLRSGDDLLLDLILRTGTLAAVPRDIVLSNIPQLLDMALFASSHVADAISIALRELWGSSPHKVQMPFIAILFALVRLGANPSILERLGLTTECVEKNPITLETLMKALKRLFAIIKAAGFAGAFSSGDVANVVLILVVMGLDSLTSSELHTQLNITMDVVCNHGATDYLLHDIHEKVLSFARQLVPVNKARLVSFFASGSGRTRCIARRLAYCLLISASIIPNNITQEQVPPLEPLILLLSPDAGSCELFDVTNESTDYEELRHHVNILSVALIDITPYVEEERTIMKSASSTSVQGSPNKSKKPPVPPLELLRRVLEVLQRKIGECVLYTPSEAFMTPAISVDTRAAHLDRSRTKAAIQRLTMRIYYERMALIGVRPRRRASTLKAYFSPQRQ